MGIRGLRKFVEYQSLSQKHELHDTEIVIDGYNLAMGLYMKYQKYNTNNHMYGGDYPLWSTHISTFFNTLKKCNIVPIVVIDGSIDPSLEKFNMKMSRFKNQLQTARKIYKDNEFIEGIIPLLNIFVFSCKLRQLGVRVFQSPYEADSVISQISCDLSCPILSNDNDFLIENLSSGVISVSNLLDNYTVYHNDENSYSFLRCEIFYIANLKRKFPTMNLDLVQLSGMLLGNDYVSKDDSEKILAKLPQIKQSIKGDKRQKNIFKLFFWISKFKTFPEIRHCIMNIMSNKQKESLILFIDSHFNILKSNGVEWSTLDEYFELSSEYLFRKHLKIPEHLKQAYIERRLPSRLMCISQVHIDFFRPLVEDFQFEDSSYDCIFELCEYIYGLLRDRDNSIPKIKCYSRDRFSFVFEKIEPAVSIGSRLLPPLYQLENLSLQDRQSLFYDIVGYKNVFDELKCYFADVPFIEQSNIAQYISMLFAMIYLLHNFDHELWIEFIYALYTNIVLGSCIFPEKLPCLLKLSKWDCDRLAQNFQQFQTVPQLTKTKVFMPRIVHFYNSYQNCLTNIHFLSQILDVPAIYDVGQCMFTLKGTFIYNLTRDLMSRPKPLLHLQELLGRDQFDQLKYFLDLLGVIVYHSQRNFMSDRATPDSEIIPTTVVGQTPVMTNRQSVEHCLLVRALDVTNRKTHIRSQKLKVNNQCKKRKGKT